MARRIALAAALVLGIQIAAASGASSPPLVKGVVDVNTNLAYQGAAAAGTGMVLTPTGLVLTNNHVIKGATTIRVYIPATGRRYPASVVGYSVPNDVAVLQIKGAPGLQTVDIGDSSRLKIGDPVTAVGNANGVGGTPTSTTGKITGLGQSITAVEDTGNEERLTGLVQTDAALAPGDSGGPLLDASNRVIGMDTAASGGFQFRNSPTGGDSFAIPINRALGVAKQIVAGQESAAVHVGATPFLGIIVRGSFGPGLSVRMVVPSSPADIAGISEGDTLTSLNGHSLTSPQLLTELLLRRSVGEKVRFRVIDGYGTASIATVTLGAGPPQ